MFGTPDFGHSDIWHQNLPFKFILSETLKNNALPFWTNKIGAGFPLFAEGESGSLNIVNLFLFKFFPLLLAVNLQLLTSFVTCFIGSYLFGKILTKSRLAGLFLAIIFTFCGPFITNISHYNHIQTLSLLPLGFYFLESFRQNHKKRYVLFLSIVISQQIFAGHYQIAFLSLMAYFGYFLLCVRKTLVIFSFVLGVVLALPQIIPTLELINLSQRSTGVSVYELARFPYNPKHLLSFLEPYIFGDPRLGTYPPFSSDWGIFWESTGYFGVIPLILALVLLFKRNKLSNIFLVGGGISLILTLGKFTPLFFIFQIPPISFFRVPARFLIILTWCLVILATISFNNIKSLKFKVAILIFSAIQILFFAFNYNPIINSDKFLARPELVQALQNDKDWFRVYSIDAYDQWNQVFLKTGWKNMDEYLSFRNSLSPNEGIFWNINSLGYYTGMNTRRSELYLSLVSQGVTITDSVSISSESAKLLSFAGVKYVTSPYLINSNPPPIATSEGKFRFYLYKLENQKPHAFLTTDLKTATSISELIKLLTDPKEMATIVEDEGLVKDIPNVKQFRSEVKITKYLDQEVVVETTSDTKALLVLSDSFYPRWKASVNNQPAFIYPVNLNQRGVIIPAGSSQIIFQFTQYW